MSGMSYNWGEIERISGVLKTSYETLTTQLKAIDDEVKVMGQNWSGASWEAFKAYYDEYKTGTIDPLSSQIGTWVTNLESLAEQAKTTQSNNTNLFGGAAQ